jgi:hypothetical protein
VPSATIASARLVVLSSAAPWVNITHGVAANALDAISKTSKAVFMPRDVAAIFMPIQC